MPYLPHNFNEQNTSLSTQAPGLLHIVCHIPMLNVTYFKCIDFIETEVYTVLILGLPRFIDWPQCCPEFGDTNFHDAHCLQYKIFWHQLLETHLTGVRVSTRGGLIPWCHKIRLLGFPFSIISQKHLVFLLPFYPTFSALLQKSTVEGDVCIKSSSSEEDC